MDSNQLFEQLRSRYPSEDCELLISQAISEGIDLNEIREMLDYLENAKRPKVGPPRKSCCLAWLGFCRL